MSCPPPRPRRLPFERVTPAIAPFARGVVVRAAQHTGIDRPDTVTLVADSGGTVGIALARGVHGEHPTVLLNAILEDELKPLARAIADLLRQAEAYGRVAVDLWMLMPDTAHIREQLIDGEPQLHVTRELTVPVDSAETDVLALSWHRELQRAIGIVKYERDQTDPAADT